MNKLPFGKCFCGKYSYSEYHFLEYFTPYATDRQLLIKLESPT